jgi:hypothetical protein
MENLTILLICILFRLEIISGFKSSQQSLEIFENCNLHFIQTINVKREKFLEMPKFYDNLDRQPRIITTLIPNDSRLVPKEHWDGLKTSKLNRQDSSSRTRIVFIDIKEGEMIGIIQRTARYQYYKWSAADVLNPAYIFVHAINPTNKTYYIDHAMAKIPFKLVFWSSLEKYKDSLFIPCIACNELGLVIKIRDFHSLTELDKLWNVTNRDMKSRILLDQADVTYGKKGMFFKLRLDCIFDTFQIF